MSEADIEIQDCLATGQSFLLDAGAGAGKTYSLVTALRLILGDKQKKQALTANGQSIACITFTNVAKDEILDRIGHDPLVRVSTIHEFLWDAIGEHQPALKTAIIKYNAQLKGTSRRKKDPDELAAALPNMKVSYSDTGTNLLRGRLHHDDLLSVALLMFAQSPMLSKLTSAQYPYLFVDEYQDTSPSVISVVLGYLLPKATKGFQLGLFGDKMQNIYHGGEHAGVGEIPANLAKSLRPIVKEENRRCSKAVIEVLNKVRTDIRQFPSADNAEGEAYYVHPGKSGADGLAKATSFIAKLGWNLSGEHTKELYLTHKLISRKAGYDDLLSVYDARASFFRERMISGEDETIAFFIDKVEPLVAAWRAGDQPKAIAQLQKNDFKLERNADKKAARAALDGLVSMQTTGTIGEVLKHIHSTRLFPILDDLAFRLEGGAAAVPAGDEEAAEREQKDQTFYRALFALPYAQAAAYAAFFLQHTPFATKHGVKGAEFDTVLVVLDDDGANWNIYSFAKYLSDEDKTKNPKRWQRSRNVFYVCCSRAKVNLAVIDLTQRSAGKDANVLKLFGDQRTLFL